MKLSTASKIAINLVRLAALFAFAMSLIASNWFNSVSSLSAFVLTFLPGFFQKRLDITLPPIYSVSISLFAFAALVLGDYAAFYMRITWWDNLLHSTSGLALSMAFFFVLLWSYQSTKRLNEISPALLIFFSFCFAVACGAIWEILEFSCDRIFNTNMQLWKEPGITGLLDTMTDIIMDTLGAVLAIIISYLYLKQSDYIKEMRKPISFHVRRK